MANIGSPTTTNVHPSRGEVVVSRISKSFGETRALVDCTFTARCGEVHAIVGENGSGKSTLAKILSGVLRPDAGTFTVLGRTPRSPREARDIGLTTIFQEVLVAEAASIADNLFVGTDRVFSRGTSAAERRRLARETLQRLAQVDVDPGTMVGNLPLALKQWIVIGRALLTDPRVLILDESSAALDLDATTRLHAEIHRLRDGGSSVIIVTHRIAELIRIADRATVLRDGKVVGELGKSEITEHNLLSLMTPQKRALPSAPAGTDRGTSGGALLAGSGMVLRKDATAFDFAIARGEIVGVAGLDGQGQDNFLRALAGIGGLFDGEVTSTREGGGSARVSGLSDADAEGIVYVSGDRKRDGIFPNLSIFENLAVALYRRESRAGGWLRDRPLRAAFARERDRLKIKTGSSNDRITSLSGGNQQKVLIARAFAKNPRLIVLNDPARGVDLGTKRELYSELEGFAARGGAVVYLSSEIEEFLGFADRVVVFREGSLFRTLDRAGITEHAMLAAMFGQPEEAIHSFALEAHAQ